MTIAVTALKEKIRKKVFYMVSIMGVLLLVLFGTGTGSISIGGTAITDYKLLAPILLTLVHAISCVMAVVLSLDTIPNEYQRQTSHLVLIRDVSQAKYHGALATANVVASLLSELILYITFLCYMLSKHHENDIGRLPVAFFLSSISVIIVCVMTSWLSIFLPKLIAGTLSVMMMLAGIFYSILELLNSIVGGFAGKLLKAVLYIVPDLHGIQKQAGFFLTDGVVDLHLLLKGFLWIYILCIFLCLFKRKEA